MFFRGDAEGKKNRWIRKVKNKNDMFICVYLVKNQIADLHSHDF